MLTIPQKMKEPETPATFITGHPGFDGVCLNVWVLQAAYNQFRQHYGTGAYESFALHK